MFYVYVIQSEKDGSYYKGHCENLNDRIKEHNSGQTKSIKSKLPFRLVYNEIFDIREEAVKREKYFKSAAGRRFLKSKLPRSSMPARPNLE
jgi:putative endonuclease